ncbi:hypothetical protein [Kitasatospora saccharophila]
MSTSGSVSRSPSGAVAPWLAWNSSGQRSPSPNSRWAMEDSESPECTVTLPWAGAAGAAGAAGRAGAAVLSATTGVPASDLASAGISSRQPGWIGRSASKRVPESSIGRPALSLAISVQRSPEPSWRSAMDHRLSAGRASRTV